MESPKTSSEKFHEGNKLFFKANSTPTDHKVTTEDFSLFYLQKESSPSYRGGQDVLEIGWGDSPEPLNIEKKSAIHKTPVPCRKKLEPKESPRSSVPSRRRTLRSALKISSNSLVDVAKYVAEVKALSESIMNELNSDKIIGDVNECKNQVYNHQLNNNINYNSGVPSPSTIQKSAINNKTKDIKETNNGKCNFQNKDSSFDNVLQSFINEEDDWLSQALSCQEPIKINSKIGFAKHKSENELMVQQNKTNKEIINMTGNSNNTNSFRRTSSFDMTKSQSHLMDINSNGLSKIREDDEILTLCATQDLPPKVPSVQYSQEEIEKKRLEAIYRRERKEIERKKMEAMKRLEMKKMRIIKT